MTNRNFSRMPLVFGLALTLITTYSMVGLAADQQRRLGGPLAELTVVGRVTLNSMPVISGASVPSDSIVATQQDSRAMLRIGKALVEILPNSSLQVRFTETSIAGSLDAGRIRVSTPEGVSASIVTKDGTTIADANQASAFTVNIECGNTAVATEMGRISLRTGSETKQIAAGNQDTAGQTTPGTRCTPKRGPELRTLGSGAIAALLLAAGGIIATSLLLARNSDDDVRLSRAAEINIVSITR